jgi:hypothetical protein
MSPRIALCSLLLAACASTAQPTPKSAEPAPEAVSTSSAEQDAPPPPPAPPASTLKIAQPLGMVTLTGDLGAMHEGKPVLFSVHAGPAAPALRTRLLISHPEARVTDDSIAIGPGALPEVVLDRHRKPSFLVDSDEKAVLELARTMPPDIKPKALRRRIGAHFVKLQYGTFWTASRAAANRAGDCSEHAVLVAAVARALGMPARVVVGYAMQTDGNVGGAFGHAWAEVHDGKKWHRLDATPVGELGDVTYVILSELDDEGPAHAVAMAELVTVMMRTEIAVTRSQP